MTWNEADHPRDAEGQFAFSSISSWAEKAVARLRTRDTPQDRAIISTGSFEPFREAARRGEHPRGHSAAKARHKELWSIPSQRASGERTDAEQAQLDTLEEAFKAYRDRLGITRDRRENAVLYQDGGGLKWTEHGNFLGDITSAPPLALQRGFQRVGDHPERAGAYGGAELSRMGARQRPSIHPQAGGLWIDPRDPGSTHSPRYRNDAGGVVHELLKSPHRTQQHKTWGQIDKLEPHYGLREGVEHETTWRGRRSPGRMGYQMESRDGTVAEFLGIMKRKRARAKVEAAPKTQVRRTPKGTRVEGWMGTVNDRMQRGQGRG